MNDILEYRGYCANVHYSAEDDIFYGKVYGINDLVSFEGETVKKLTHIAAPNCPSVKKGSASVK